MASHLNGTEFQIGSTQTITGIQTAVNNSNSEIPTSKAIRDFIDNTIPVSLTVSGNWTNTQYISEAVDITGLTFTVTYKSGTTANVIPSVRPLVWSDTVGTQTATFYYTENGVTVSASKSASVEVNWLTVPLTLQAREAGNIRITKNGDPGIIYYSKNGSAQSELASNTNIPVVAGDKVSLFRTLSDNLTGGNYLLITCTNNCYVYGNMMSLYSKDSFSNSNSISYNYAFYGLFTNNTYIDINESVGRLVLPATTLSYGCYVRMFNGCHSLTTAPALPATTLAEYCYQSMFSGCHNLTTAPVLPATTLAQSCYSNMFNGCTSLTTAPTLPATTLAAVCYFSMFNKCTNLTTAPTLSATTLAIECCNNMFAGCTSLTTAPTLPATTLAERCYANMFSRCTSLTSITCLATDISASRCTMGWLYNVAASGTFTTPSSTAWITGYDGIPSGWTRVNA